MAQDDIPGVRWAPGGPGGAPGGPGGDREVKTTHGAKMSDEIQGVFFYWSRPEKF